MECAEGHEGVCGMGCPDHVVGETCMECNEFFSSWGFESDCSGLQNHECKKRPIECIIALHAILLKDVLLMR